MKHDPNLFAEQTLRSVLQRLRLVRRARGISQSELARLIGISQNAYCRIENGQRELSLQRYLAMAAVLDIPPNQLLDGNGAKMRLLMSKLITSAFPTLQVDMSFSEVLRGCILGLVGGTLGALYPAYKAARMDPVQALSYE